MYIKIATQVFFCMPEASLDTLCDMGANISNLNQTNVFFFFCRLLEVVLIQVGLF